MDLTTGSRSRVTPAQVIANPLARLGNGNVTSRPRSTVSMLPSEGSRRESDKATASMIALLNAISVIAVLPLSVASITFPVIQAPGPLPTICYGSILLVTVIVRMIPRRVHSIVSRTVYLLTTDATPVFSRLGTLCGGIGAVLALLKSL